MNCRISVILFFGGLFCVTLSAQQPKRAYHVPEFAHTWHLPSLHPDHIILNLTEDPSTSMSVTWRTNVEVLKGYAEIALATAAPKFWRNATTLKA
ncbi:MAG: fibronectin type III domain-containing protein, partial [Bacteroidota bacterium]